MCDVFVQGFWFSLFVCYGLFFEEIFKINLNIIMVNMLVFGLCGLWVGWRGYDLFVQMCFGMNVFEVEYVGKGEFVKFILCQVLDYVGGYYLVIGVIVVVYCCVFIFGFGLWCVDVFLVGVMKYLRSMGQYLGVFGFESKDYEKFMDVLLEFFEIRDIGFGFM